MLFKIFGFHSPASPLSRESTQESNNTKLDTALDTAAANTADASAAELDDIGGDSHEDDTGLTRSVWKPILIRLSIGTGLVGIAGVFGLPLLLNSVTCGDMFKTYVGSSYTGSMNRAQQAFYAENGSFAADWAALNSASDLDLEQTTIYYRLVSKPQAELALNYALVRQAQSDDSRQVRQDRQEMFAYVGAVAPLPPGGLPENAAASSQPQPGPTLEPSRSTQTILCRAQEPGWSLPAAPTLVDGLLTCASGTERDR